MIIRGLERSDFDAVIEIAQSLPEWFTNSGIDSIRKDIVFQMGIIGIENRLPVGFLTFFVNQGVATIGWMGVRPNYHRGGVGKAMLEHLKDCLARARVNKILVSTLGDSVDYEPYARTRAFYRKSGFSDSKLILHPDNPEQEEELILELKF